MWVIKIMIKLLLGHLPFKHQLFRHLYLFRHGAMDEPSYVLKVFRQHFEKAFPEGPPNDFVALELGPGDSLASCLIANSFGVKKIYHLDVGSYATKDIRVYRKIAQILKHLGIENIPNIDNLHTIEEMLALCNATYLTNGLNGFKIIPSDTVDFIWSQSVLEHIRKKDFKKMMVELYRVLKSNGLVSHTVDLQDHLQKSLHNLRFSESLWEREFFANSGFYTNRLRYSESLKIMEDIGFKISSVKKILWEKLPISRKKLNADFRHLSDKELRIYGYRILLTK